MALWWCGAQDDHTAEPGSLIAVTGSATPSTVLIGRYRLDLLIGRGAMAEVWRAHDLTRDWPVAVKVFAPLNADPSMRARFAQEARTAARVVHTNVVSVFDVGDHDGRPFLVMELLSGRSLADELAERGQLPLSEVRRLLGQAAVGLDAAHRSGVIHRDVKPANLHVTDDGQLKVVDFGIARLAGEVEGRLTAVGTVVGTPAYMSPEQIIGRPGEAPADLYALGCVAYEMLCGRPPFTGSAVELIQHHLNLSPEPPNRLRPDVPPELEALTLALLDKDPEARPTAGQLLSRLHSGRPVQPTVPTAVPRPTTVLEAPPAPQGPSGRTAALAITGVAVAVLLLLLVFRPDQATPTPQAARPAAPASAAPTSAAATPTPTRPTATPTRPRPTPTRTDQLSTWLLGLDRAVLAQVKQGGLDGDTAEGIRGRIAKARHQRDTKHVLKAILKARNDGELSGRGPLIDYLTRSGLTFGQQGGDDD
jgi:eukaryotic-like serine/threonine-protein kinase